MFNNIQATELSLTELNQVEGGAKVTNAIKKKPASSITSIAIGDPIGAIGGTSSSFTFQVPIAIGDPIGTIGGTTQSVAKKS